MVRYSVAGDERKRDAIDSYFLLDYPVKGNFRFYAGSDPELVDGKIKVALSRLEGLSDFKGLFVTSDQTPFAARLLARPFGFGYKPGLLLWKWGTDVFDPMLLKRDFDLLLSLAEEGA